MADQSSLVSGVAGRYATALFEIADEAGALDAVADDMNALKQALADSADLRDLVSSPIYSRDEQGAAMAAIADKMGVHGLTRNVLGLMAQNRRLFTLGGVVDAFNTLLADKRGIVAAEVTSATPLSADQTAKLVDTIKAAVGKDITINETVDESLIGGLIVKVGSRMIDTSIRSRLAGMQNAMKEVG